MYSILNCLLFLLVQITQDAVLYTCRFPGTATSLGSAKDCSVPQAFEELEQCTVQQCQQCQSLSMGVQHNFGTPFSPTRVPSITKATKQPFLHPPAGINHQQAGCVMLWHRSSSHGHTDCCSHTWRRSSKDSSPIFG